MSVNRYAAEMTLLLLRTAEFRYLQPLHAANLFTNGATSVAKHQTHPVRTASPQLPHCL